MTVVDDITSVAPPRSHVAGFPDVDLEALRAVFAEAAAVVDEASSDTELVDRMTRLAALRSSVEALQATTELSFARVHVGRRIDAGETDPEHLERSVASMIGLANRVSPTIGGRRLRVARDLHDGLDHVRHLFAEGRINEYRATLVANATAHLDHAERAEVDRRLAGRDIPGLGSDSSATSSVRSWPRSLRRSSATVPAPRALSDG